MTTCDACGAIIPSSQTICRECWANGVGESFATIATEPPRSFPVTMMGASYWSTIGYSYRDRVFADMILALRELRVRA